MSHKERPDFYWQDVLIRRNNRNWTETIFTTVFFSANYTLSITAAGICATSTLQLKPKKHTNSSKHFLFNVHFLFQAWIKTKYNPEFICSLYEASAVHQIKWLSETLNPPFVFPWLNEDGVFSPSSLCISWCPVWTGGTIKARNPVSVWTPDCGFKTDVINVLFPLKPSPPQFVSWRLTWTFPAGCSCLTNLLSGDQQRLCESSMDHPSKPPLRWFPLFSL